MDLEPYMPIKDAYPYIGETPKSQPSCALWVQHQHLFSSPTQIPSLIHPFPSNLCPEPLPDDSSFSSWSHLRTGIWLSCQLCLALRDPGHCDPGTSWLSSLGSESPLFLTFWIPFPLLSRAAPHFFWEVALLFQIVLVKISVIVLQTLPSAHPTSVIDACTTQAKPTKALLPPWQQWLIQGGGLSSSWTNQSSSLGVISRCQKNGDLCFCCVCLIGCVNSC